MAVDLQLSMRYYITTSRNYEATAMAVDTCAVADVQQPLLVATTKPLRWPKFPSRENDSNSFWRDIQAVALAENTSSKRGNEYPTSCHSYEAPVMAVENQCSWAIAPLSYVAGTKPPRWLLKLLHQVGSYRHFLLSQLQSHCDGG
jgi:hypothetical protein